MDTIGAYEAKTHLSRLLERVKEGESIVITKHGTPIAVLQPFSQKEKNDTKSVINKLKEFRENTGAKLAGLTIRGNLG